MASYNNTFTFAPAPDSQQSGFHLQPPAPPPPPGLMPGQFAPAPFPPMDAQLIVGGSMNYSYSTEQQSMSQPDLRVIAGMPLAFYNHIPPNNQAIFSTKNGAKPFRYISDLPTSESLPPLIVRSDLSADVKTKIKALKEEFPVHIIKSVRPLESWYDLYKYFDAVELCTEGPDFLFNLIQQLLTDTETIDQEFKEEARKVIDNFAQVWVEDHQELLLQRRFGNVIDLFDDNDKKNLDYMTFQEKEWLREFLNARATDLELKLFRENPLVFQQPGQIALSDYRPLPVRQTNSTLANYGLDPQTTSVHPNYGGLVSQGIPALPNDGRPTFQASPMLPVNGPPMLQPNHRQQPCYNYFSPHRNRSGTFYTQNRNSNYNRPRGWSNDTARNRRNNNGNARYNDGRNFSQRPSPPKSNMEPMYFLNPQANQGQRIFSEPVQGSYNPRNVSDPNFMVQDLDRLYPGHLPVKPPQLIPISSDESNEKLQSPDSATTVRGFPYSRVPSGSSAEPTANNSFDGEPCSGVPLKISENGSKIFRYVSVQPQAAREDQRLRTVHIVGVDEAAMFLNHELKAMMSQNGTVEQICYLNESNSFVTFTEESAVQLAIRQWNNFLTPLGLTMLVSVPREANRQISYDRRRLSQSRDFSKGSSYDGSPRHSSFKHQNQQSTYLRNTSRKSSGRHTAGFEMQLLPMQFNSAFTDTTQNQTAISRIEHVIPLKQIQNMPEKIQPMTDQRGVQRSPASQKENQPMFYSRQDSSLNGTKNAKGKNSKKKTKQNSSKRITPNNTPTKPRSISSSILGENDAIVTNPGEQSEVTPLTDKSWKRTKHLMKNKPYHTNGQNQSSVSRNDSFETETSDVTKPLSTAESSEKSSEKSFNQSSNTSFSTNSSRKQSVAELENANTNTDSGVCSMPSQSQEKNVALHQLKKFLSEEPHGNDNIPYEVVQSISEKSQGKNIDKGHSKKASNTSMSSKSSIRKADLSGSGDDEFLSKSPNGKKSASPAELDPANKTPRSSRDNKKGPAHCEMFNASPKIGTKAPSHTEISQKTPQSRNNASASAGHPITINIDDTMEWPSLLPARSPVSSIADGKRPPPPTPVVYNSEKSVNKQTASVSSKANMVQSDAYSLEVTRTLGTRLWPFVKKFRCK